MNDTESMEIGHARRSFRELQDVGGWEKEMWKNCKQAHQPQTICVWIGSYVLHHIPPGHPLGENVEKM